jgi:hypothetical protein
MGAGVPAETTGAAASARVTESEPATPGSGSEAVATSDSALGIAAEGGTVSMQGNQYSE